MRGTALALGGTLVALTGASVAAGQGASETVVFVRAASQADGAASVQRSDVRTGKTRQLAGARTPITDVAVSADGKRIAYAVAGRRSASVRVVRSSGSRDKPIATLDRGHSVLGLSWMPKGDRLVYAAAKLNRSAADLFSMPAGGGEAVRLTKSRHDEIHPAVTPDGERVLFARTGPTGFDLYALTFATGNVRRLTFTKEQEYWPAVSPDGQRIAYSRDDGRRVHLVIADADGTGPVVIRDGPDNAYEPSWSPDGERLVFSGVGANGRPQLYTVDAAGAEVRRVLKSRSVDGRPVYLP